MRGQRAHPTRLPANLPGEDALHEHQRSLICLLADGAFGQRFSNQLRLSSAARGWNLLSLLILGTVGMALSSSSRRSLCSMSSGSVPLKGWRDSAYPR